MRGRSRGWARPGLRIRCPASGDVADAGRDQARRLEDSSAVAVLSALSDAVDARPYMRGHAGRVTRLAELVAVRLGWKRSRLAMLRVGGRLHDVGKLAIDERILRKPGPLTPDEFAEIRR